jgi:hypothetical protein
VLANRIGGVIDRLIASNQTAFIKCRYILESVITTHEVIHSVHQRNQKGFILKLDYEKVYDKVNWEFLLDILAKRDLVVNGLDGLRLTYVEGLLD